MAEHVIILALSAISKDRRSGQPTSYENIPLRSFAAPDLVVSDPRFCGRQTNEAPVCALLCSAHKKSDTVARIVYLKSDACGEYTLVDSAGSTCTTENVFQRAVEKFCTNESIPLPVFIPISYDPAHSQDSIDLLIKQTAGNVVVDIDTTGGLRDAVNLITLAIQTIRLRDNGPTAQGVHLGDIVYANIHSKVIEAQNEQYGLIELVNAIDSFTRYGRSQQVKDFFSDKQQSGPLKKLLEEMSGFSDNLLLCRADAIDANVTRIHRAFDTLLQESTDNYIDTGELLFRHLIPSIKAGFIQPVQAAGGFNRNRALQYVAIIRWCLEHRMLQQALALYCEKVPFCLGWLGYLAWGPKLGNFPEQHPVDEVGCIKQLSGFNSNINGVVTRAEVDRRVRIARDIRQPNLLQESPHIHPSPRLIAWKQLICSCRARTAANSDFITVTDNGENLLPAVLVWYCHLYSIRNEVMHVDADSNQRRRKELNKAVRVAFVNSEDVSSTYGTGNNPNRVDQLQNDLKKALIAPERGVKLELTAIGAQVLL